MDQPNSTVATSNFSSSPGLLPHPSWNSRGLVPAIVLSFCFLLGVPGNIAVIICRPKWHHVSSLSQSLLLNLAISDLLGLLITPLWIYSLLYGWTFNLVSCKLAKYIGYFGVYGSLLTVTGLSIQRYLMVVHQLSCNQVKKRLLLFLLWLVASILSTPCLVVQQLVPDQPWTDCRPQYSSDAQGVGVLMTETVVVFVSFSIVAFSYIRLKKTVNQAALFNNPQTTRLVTSIIVSFCVLWAPYHIINIVGVAAISLKNERMLKVHADTWDIGAAVTFFNRCLNPFLYAFTSCQIFTVCCKKNPMQQNQRIPQTQDVPMTAEL